MGFKDEVQGWDSRLGGKVEMQGIFAELTGVHRNLLNSQEFAGAY